jgi:hypothetical protein
VKEKLNDAKMVVVGNTAWPTLDVLSKLPINAKMVLALNTLNNALILVVMSMAQRIINMETRQDVETETVY